MAQRRSAQGKVVHLHGSNYAYHFVFTVNIVLPRESSHPRLGKRTSVDQLACSVSCFSVAIFMPQHLERRWQVLLFFRGSFVGSVTLLPVNSSLRACVCVCPAQALFFSFPSVSPIPSFTLLSFVRVHRPSAYMYFVLRSAAASASMDPALTDCAVI